MAELSAWPCLLYAGWMNSGYRDIIAVKPTAKESRDSYGVLFQSLKERGLTTPKLVISDVHAGLVAAIRESFSGASWQRCKSQHNFIFQEPILRTSLDAVIFFKVNDSLHCATLLCD